MSGKKLKEIIESYELDKPASWLVIRKESETDKGVITWKVKRSEILRVTQVGKYLKSPYFHLGPKKYCSNLSIAIYPCGRELPCENFVSLLINFNQAPSKGTTIKVLASAVNQSGETLIATKLCGFNEKLKAVVNDEFILKDSLDQFLSSDELILRCVIKIKSRLTQCVSDKVQYYVHPDNESTNSYRSMLENESLSDVKLNVGTERISAHKAILAAKVSDFKTFFKSAPSEDAFNIQDVDGNTLRKVIHFIYTNDIPVLNFQNACNLFVAADNYGVWELKEICSAYLGANLTTKNVFVVQMLANKHNDLALKTLCIDFVKKCDSSTLASESVIVND